MDHWPLKWSISYTQINQLLPSQDNHSKFDWSLIVATQDWHPPNHTSFASQHENVAPFTEIEFIHPEKKLDPKTNQPIVMNQIVWPDHCVQGTKELSWNPCLLINLKINKTRR